MHPDERAADAATDDLRAAALPGDHVPGPEAAASALLEDDAAVAAEGVDDTDAEIMEAEVSSPATAAILDLHLPDDPAQARDELASALIEARGEALEYLEAVQRVAAEYENYRKRIERDHTDSVRRASQRVIEQLLPTLDSFDAALSYEPQTPAEEKILDGVRGTHAVLLEALAREGLEPVTAVGALFDPAVHEAVSGPSGAHGDLVVAEELRRGYTLGGRLIRPSLVAVEMDDRADDPEKD